MGNTICLVFGAPKRTPAVLSWDQSHRLLASTKRNDNQDMMGLVYFYIVSLTASVSEHAVIYVNEVAFAGLSVKSPLPALENSTGNVGVSPSLLFREQLIFS